MSLTQTPPIPESQTPGLHDLAKSYVASGLSVIPIRADGTKSPTISSWKPYQERLPNDAELQDWFGNGKNSGIAVIAGSVSGNIEIVDFDDPNTAKQWSQLIQRAGAADLLIKLPVVQTPSGGWHLFYKCSVIKGNQKLAQREVEQKKLKVLIETRGEGGYVIAPGSPAGCHKTGKMYTLIRGSLLNIPTITSDERDLLLSFARSLNEYLPPGDIVSGEVTMGHKIDGNRPGDDFNNRASWDEILTPHGWTQAGQNRWRKPGDTGAGHHVTTDHFPGVFYCFSTAVYPFEAGRGYRKFTAYALLNHGGDYSAAAKALIQQGYGNPVRPQGTKHSKPEHITETPAWEEDRPLYRELSPAEKFPLDALGDLLGLAVKRCHEVIQAPDSVCAYSFLAASNSAVQAHVDIEIDERIMPVSDFFATIAETGDRKTATDSVACAAHELWQQAKIEEYSPKYRDYKAAQEVYEASRSKLLRDKNLDQLVKQNKLASLIEPEQPLYPLIICGEPTYEGLVRQLASGYPSMTLSSNEGGRFLGGNAMNKENMLKTAAGLSELWDRGKFDRVRSGDGASVHYGKRLAMHIMIQPDLAPLLFGNSLLVGQGLISRILPTAPQAINGRKYNAAGLSTDPAITAYRNRILELLNLPLPLKQGTRNSLDPTRIKLSPKAKEGYQRFHDSIQSKIGYGGQLYSVRGFANKAHDHAARIAATLAGISDIKAAFISLEDFERGVIIVTFAMSELKRLLDCSVLSGMLIDAQRLLDWLILRGGQLICLREVYQRGPSNIRSAKTAEDLMHILYKHGKVRPTAEKVEYSGSQSPAWEIRAFSQDSGCSKL